MSRLQELQEVKDAVRGWPMFAPWRVMKHRNKGRSVGCAGGVVADACTEPLARYIATFDPPTIAKLLAIAKALAESFEDASHQVQVCEDVQYSDPSRFNSEGEAWPCGDCLPCRQFAALDAL